MGLGLIRIRGRMFGITQGACAELEEQGSREPSLDG